MAYEINFTEQSVEGAPFETKTFSLPDGRFIELKDPGTQQQGQGQLIITPPTAGPNPYLLAGRKSENWGEVIGENILKLIEHQASFEVSSNIGTFTAIPQAIVHDTAIRGQVWYNLTDEHLYTYNGFVWERATKSEDTVPFATTAGNANLLNGFNSNDFVMKSGDTMGGFLTLNADPTSLTHAATKRYVDDQISGALTGTVVTVFGRTGNIVALAGDYTASQITFVPAGNLSSVNVQDALEELDIAVTNTSASINYIMNGDFQIWQRGPGPFNVGVGNTIYTSDRWRATAASQTTFAGLVTRESHIGGDIIDGQPRSYIKWAVTSAAGSSGDAGNIAQLIENSKTLNSRKATLSFWARSATSNSIKTNVQRVHGTGGSATEGIASTTFNLTPTWTKYSMPVIFPSLSGITSNDVNSYILVDWNLGPNTIGELRISQVQLEPGTIAHNFLMEPRARQQVQCERFYQIGRFRESANGITLLTNEKQIEFRTTMRATPSITGNFIVGGGSNVSANIPVFSSVDGFGTQWSSTVGGDSAPYVDPWQANAEL